MDSGHVLVSCGCYWCEPFVCDCGDGVGVVEDVFDFFLGEVEVYGYWVGVCFVVVEERFDYFEFVVQ